MTEEPSSPPPSNRGSGIHSISRDGPLSYPVDAVASDIGAPEPGILGAIRYARRVTRVRGRVAQALAALADRERIRGDVRRALATAVGERLAAKGGTGDPSLEERLNALKATENALSQAREAAEQQAAAVASRSAGAHELLARRAAARQEASEIRQRLEARVAELNGERQTLAATLETLKAGDADAKTRAVELQPSLELKERELAELRERRGEADSREAAARGAEAQARMALESSLGSERGRDGILAAAIRDQTTAVSAQRERLAAQIELSGRQWLEAGRAAPEFPEWSAAAEGTRRDRALAEAYQTAQAVVDAGTYRTGRLWLVASWALPALAAIIAGAVFTLTNRSSVAGVSAPEVPPWAISRAPALESLADAQLPAGAAGYAAVRVSEAQRLGLDEFAGLDAESLVVAAVDDLDSFAGFTSVLPARDRLETWTGHVPGNAFEPRLHAASAAAGAFVAGGVAFVPEGSAARFGRGALYDALGAPMEPAAWRRHPAVQALAAHLPTEAPAWFFANGTLLQRASARLEAVPLPAELRRALRRTQRLGAAFFVRDGAFVVVAAEFESPERASNTKSQLDALVTAQRDVKSTLGASLAQGTTTITLRVHERVLVAELAVTTEAMETLNP